MQIKNSESSVRPLQDHGKVSLGPDEASETRVPLSTLERHGRKQLFLVALWKIEITEARLLAERDADKHRFVFAQSANRPALPGSLVRELASEGIQLIYVPARFEGSDVNDELYEFAREALDRQARQTFDANEVTEQSVDEAAASAMRSRMQQQTVPSPSDIRELARDFYEANEFERPGHR